MVSTLIQPSYAQTVQTKNIPPDADLYVIGYPSSRVHIANNSEVLLVGWNAANHGPYTSYVRFNLRSIQGSNMVFNAFYDFFFTVSYNAVLKLLGRGHLSQNATNNHYIVTVASVNCTDPYWKETGLWDESNCPRHGVDDSTASSMIIPESSLPNFYEWPVTSAVKDALDNSKGEITFKITGYPVDAKMFDGGVVFWSKEATSHVSKNFFAGSTDMLIVNSTTTLSDAANLILIIGTAAGAIFAGFAILRWITKKKKLENGTVY